MAAFPHQKWRNLGRLLIPFGGTRLLNAVLRWTSASNGVSSLACATKYHRLEGLFSQNSRSSIPQRSTCNISHAILKPGRNINKSPQENQSECCF